jgi:O-antigen/teichoic acid export membrane protein
MVFHFIGASALAVYSFATIIPERLTGILKFIPNLMLPKLAPKDESQVRGFLARKLWILLSFIAAIAAAYALIAPWLFHTFFPTYSDSVAFTQVYSLSFFSLGVSIVQTVLTSLRKTKELYLYSFGMPVIKSVLMAALLFYYGIWGLLWAQMITNFAALAFLLILLGRKPAPQPA